MIITIAGDENAYAKSLKQQYGAVEGLIFRGKIDREEVYALYERTGCLLFPSKLETWGLPLTEVKAFNKPILAADLGYAHETIGEYDQVSFFDINDATALASLMESSINGTIKYEGNRRKAIEGLFVAGWDNLIKVLLANFAIPAK